MVTVHPQFIKDANGEKSMVILPINEFDAIMEELEDMEDVRLYDEAQKCNEPSIPIDEAFKMIEAIRKVQ